MLARYNVLNSVFKKEHLYRIYTISISVNALADFEQNICIHVTEKDRFYYTGIPNIWKHGVVSMVAVVMRSGRYNHKWKNTYANK